LKIQNGGNRHFEKHKNRLTDLYGFGTAMQKETLKSLVPLKNLNFTNKRWRTAAV